MENDFTDRSVVIICNNQVAKFVMSNTNYSRRSKHIDLKYFYYRNEVEQQHWNIEIIYALTEMML